MEDDIDRLVPDVFSRRCDSRTALEHVTGRWGILAMAALLEGTFRFNALRRRVDGVSEKMLAQTLQQLERDGFVHREARPTIPPHVEYSLTALGRAVAERLHDLIELVEGRLPEVLAARAAYDAAVTGVPGRSRAPAGGATPGPA
ncbi:HxlR family transcriptional regulator [Prauserella shujinwangii]|uniref:HxlR family transcriptional regulator n=1 Tax=Prauserella shujinwangii TaxID=1453103 RepID=A0A2T0M111_9PSEU|nr:helix-turn-helix domain-containing protein [Prauserella shujinwangii]PRX50247.1 HxlR family transcriptional regulator [Prauserella shujinwangii]